MVMMWANTLAETTREIFKKTKGLTPVFFMLSGAGISILPLGGDDKEEDADKCKLAMKHQESAGHDVDAVMFIAEAWLTEMKDVEGVTECIGKKEVVSFHLESKMFCKCIMFFVI